MKQGDREIIAAIQANGVGGGGSSGGLTDEELRLTPVGVNVAKVGGQDVSTGDVPVVRGLRSTTVLTKLKITNAAASGNTTLVAAVAGQTTRVHRMILSVAGACIVKVLRGTTELGVFNFAGNGAGVVLDFSEEPWYITSANELLKINVSAAVQVDGQLGYVTSA